MPYIFIVRSNLGELLCAYSYLIFSLTPHTSHHHLRSWQESTARKPSPLGRTLFCSFAHDNTTAVDENYSWKIKIPCGTHHRTAAEQKAYLEKITNQTSSRLSTLCSSSDVDRTIQHGRWTGMLWPCMLLLLLYASARGLLFSIYLSSSLSGTFMGALIIYNTGIHAPGIMYKYVVLRSTEL